MTGRQTQVQSSALSVVRLGFVLGGLVVAVESAVATHHVAVTRGVREDTMLAWLTPIGIEGLAMACVAAHVYRRAIGQRSGLPLTGAALFGALAVWINVTAVEGSSLIAYAMAASAPIGLMLIVHVYPWTGSPVTESESGAADHRSSAVHAPLSDRSTEARGRVAGQAPVTVTDDPESESDDRGATGRGPVALHAVRSEGDRAGQPLTGTADTAIPAGPDRDEAVDRMLADNPGITGREVGEALGGLSEKTGRRLLAQARERAERSA